MTTYAAASAPAVYFGTEEMLREHQRIIMLSAIRRSWRQRVLIGVFGSESSFSGANTILALHDTLGALDEELRSKLLIEFALPPSETLRTSREASYPSFASSWIRERIITPAQLQGAKAVAEEYSLLLVTGDAARLAVTKSGGTDTCLLVFFGEPARAALDEYKQLDKRSSPISVLRKACRSTHAVTNNFVRLH